MKNRAAEAAFFDTHAKTQETWGGHGFPRASMIGSCLTQQWFAVMEAREPRNPLYIPAPRDGMSIWNADEGTWLEPQAYEVLRKMGYVVHSIQSAAVLYRPQGADNILTALANEQTLAQLITKLQYDGHQPLVTMHIDGMLEHGPDDIHDTLLELKKLTMYSFSGIVQNGIKTEKPGYYAQAQMSMLAFGLPTARLYVFAKDMSAVRWHFTVQRSKNPIAENPSLHVEDIAADPVAQQQGIIRAQLVLDAAVQGEPPRPDPGLSPFNIKINRDGSEQNVFPCSYCDFFNSCVKVHTERWKIPAVPFVVEDNRTKEKQRATSSPATTAQADSLSAHLGPGEDREDTHGVVLPFPVPDQLRPQ